MYTLSRRSWNTKTMVKISVLGVISLLLMQFEFPVIFLAPGFLKMDISDIPALIGAFAIGPMAGIIVQLIKNILHLFQTTTVGVGELANFVVGSTFAYTAGYIYYKDKTFKKAVKGLLIGTLTMTIVITIANYFIMFPFYAKLYGIDLDTIIGMGNAINKNIINLKSMMLIAVIPFNLLKGIIVTAITLLIYKKVSPILHK